MALAPSECDRARGASSGADGKCIVDFLVPSLKLVTELDSGYHAKRAHADAKRDRALELAGYRALRVRV